MTDTRDTTLTLSPSDGTTMTCHASEPSAGEPRGGLLLLQEAFGVNDHIIDLARRLANEGYRVIAPELYHRTAPGFQADYDDIDQARAEMAKLTEDGLTADLVAAHEWLKSGGVAEERIASIGFCLGGRVAFLANLALPLAGAISFYGGGIPGLADRFSQGSGPHLLVWGGRDHAIDREQREATERGLDEAGRLYTSIVFSEAGHGFFCDRRDSYAPSAAAQAWPLTLAFLEQVIPGRGR
ncbi:MAG TPA: dienelactone hydrolase family protein [Gammaproteobacteria bacterium]|nr:dienelactone hydrolase family protein [Gammaproteobacteria bacterium]